MNINFRKKEDLDFLANYDFREDSGTTIKQNSVCLRSSYTRNITCYNLKDSRDYEKQSNHMFSRKKTSQES